MRGLVELGQLRGEGDEEGFGGSCVNHVVDDYGDNGQVIANPHVKDAGVGFAGGVPDAAQSAVEMLIEEPAGQFEAIDPAEAAEDVVSR